MENQIETESTVKEPIIGEFKTNRKYTSFVSAASGAKVRFIRDTAFLKGKRLSGMLEDVTFKITICDDATINFEEVGGNTVDREMIARLIDDIDSHPHTGYAQKFVLKGLEFEDAEGSLCYLELEEKKPIDRLKSLFEDKPEISEKGLGFLDDLFGAAEDESEDADEKDEVALNEEEAKIESPKAKSESQIYMEESFRKMNEEKANELKKRVAEFESDILKYTRDIKSAEAKLGEINEKLAVTQTRLESLTPGEESNGYAFFVSEEQKLDAGLDESTKAIADKIADLMKLKKEVLFDYLTGSFYRIRISKIGEQEKEQEIDPEIIQKIIGIDINGKFSQTAAAELEYRGDLNWHQLVAKMIRNGFEQDEEFDKICGSNSYESKGDAEE